MQENTLIQVLSKCNAVEHRQLALWLASPFHNRRQQPLLLYQYIVQCFQKKEPFEEQSAWEYVVQAIGASEKPRETRGRKANLSAATLHPSHGKSATEMRLLMSELLSLTEAFLVYKHRESQEVEYQIILTGLYRARGMEKIFQKNYSKTTQLLHKYPWQHVEFHKMAADLAFEWYQYAGDKRQTDQLNVQEVSERTDTVFMARKLREACLAISYQAVYQQHLHQGLLPSVLSHIASHAVLLKIPAIALYYYCYCLFAQRPDFSFFKTFQTQLMADRHLLPPEEQRILYLLGINYCILHINTKNHAYCQPALDLYQSGLATGLLIEHEVISHMAFNNIVSIALKINATDWARPFIRSYGQYLESKHQAATIHLNEARIFYTERQYDLALAELSAFQSRDQANNLLARTLEIKICYERNDFDQLELALQNLQGYIKRQRIIGYYKTNYLHFVQYTKKLMLLNPNDKSARKKLAETIAQEKHLVDQEWLIEQVRGSQIF